MEQLLANKLFAESAGIALIIIAAGIAIAIVRLVSNITRRRQ